jgi:methionyl-tRNA formyltransferase
MPSVIEIGRGVINLSIAILTTTFNGHFMLQELVLRGLPVNSVVGLNSREFAKLGSERASSKAFSESAGINFFEAESYTLQSESDQNLFDSIDADYLLVLGWQRLVPKKIFTKFKSIGLHGSDKGISLGKGRSPQNWALIMGAESFEFSAFLITEAVDSGEILGTAKVLITDCDDIQSLHMKVGFEAVKLLESILLEQDFHLLQSKAPIENRKELSEFFPKRLPLDGAIDWNRQSMNIHNFIRALSYPYSGAFTMLNSVRVYVVKSRILVTKSEDKFCPGRIRQILTTNQLVVECVDGLLLIDVATESALKIEAQDVFSSTEFATQMNNIFSRHLSDNPNAPIASRLVELR